MSKIISYFFDITTSARWSGHPVGIVRVERELAARAREHVGDSLSFCVYDNDSGDFRSVNSDLVGPLLTGAVSIDFGTSAHSLASPSSRSLRRQLRNMALEVPTAYQFIQRLRGRNFSIEDIKMLRSQLKPSTASKQSTKMIPLQDATRRIEQLDDSVAIISGGLDWEHKRIRAIYALKKRLKFKFISIIYDLIPIKLPHYVVPHYVNLLTEYFGELLWTTDGCLCISETTRADFTQYCLDNQVPPPPALAFPLGSDIKFDIDPKLDDLPDTLVGKKYVLYVSTIEPRKNHRTVYEAWCHALSIGAIDAKSSRLVFVGRQGWLTGDLVHEFSSNPLTRDTIITLANVSDGQLASLYGGASFTVFPSFYEGFGLPLAEALGYGKVCVTSGAGALSEIGTGVRIDIDPRDTLGWSAKLAHLLNHEAEVQALEDQIKDQHQSVSWDQSAQHFFTALKKIVS